MTTAVNSQNPPTENPNETRTRVNLRPGRSQGRAVAEGNQPWGGLVPRGKARQPRYGCRRQGPRQLHSDERRSGVPRARHWAEAPQIRKSGRLLMHTIDEIAALLHIHKTAHEVGNLTNISQGALARL